MMARRVLAMVAQLRFGHAAIVATPSADVALAGVYLELRDIEQGYVFFCRFRWPLIRSASWVVFGMSHRRRPRPCVGTAGALNQRQAL